MNTILITGAAKRGGAAIAQRLHARGFRVIVHCRSSSLADAETLCKSLNAKRPESAIVWSQALDGDMPAPPMLESISGIVANASCYVPSTLDNFDQCLNNDLQAHLVGHLHLIRLCKDALIQNRGAIVAITDIHVQRPLKGFLSYHLAKGALDTAVRALAVELAPHVRVNAVAPGTLEWPTEGAMTEERKTTILQSIPLDRIGTFDELARAVEFLLVDATYTTGATLTVDGGRSTFLE
jgi:pteridine reductase